MLICDIFRQEIIKVINPISKLEQFAFTRKRRKRNISKGIRKFYNLPLSYFYKYVKLEQTNLIRNISK